MRRLLLQSWGVLLLGAAWQIYVMAMHFNSIVIVTPLAVLRDIAMHPGIYILPSLWTLGFALAGLAGGLIVGVLLAILAWTSRTISGMLYPLALLLSSTPVVCLIPMLARIFGYKNGTGHRRDTYVFSRIRLCRIRPAQAAPHVQRTLLDFCGQFAQAPLSPCTPRGCAQHRHRAACLLRIQRSGNHGGGVPDADWRTGKHVCADERGVSNRACLRRQPDGHGAVKRSLLRGECRRGSRAGALSVNLHSDIYFQGVLTRA